MNKFYVVSTKNASLEFEVVKFDPTTKRARLRGRLGTEFEEDISAEVLKNLGYKLEKREVPNA